MLEKIHLDRKSFAFIMVLIIITAGYLFVLAK